MAALKTRPKVAKRDPNVPVASFKIGNTTYEIRVTGAGEYCTAPHNHKHHWGGKTASLIVTERSPYGIRDVEHDIHDPSTWGWIVRLITDGTLDRKEFIAVSKTDEQLLKDSI